MPKPPRTTHLSDVVQRPAVAVLAGELELSCLQIDVRLPIVLLDQRRRVFPREPEVQREIVAHAEIILRVDADPMLDVCERGYRAALPLERHVVEQEISEAEAGEGARVVEVAENPLVA